MSDPKDHKPDDEQHDSRRSTQEIVEDIRHEIEEAVEHVPETVRWTLGKIVRVGMLAAGAVLLVAVITAILFVANQTRWVAGELSLIANQALALRSDVALDVKDMGGNLYNRVEAIDASVRFRDSDLPPLLEASRVHASYSLWGFVTGRPRIDVIVESPVVRISRDADGMMRLPVWRSGTASTAVTTYDVRLVLRDATVILPDQPEARGIHLDASLHTGKPTRVTLHELRWDDAPYLGRLDMARGALSAGDSIKFSLEEFRTADLDLSAFGGWEPGPSDEVKERHFHVQVDRLRWGWLAEVFRNPNLDVPGEGAAVVEVYRDSLGHMRGQFLAEVDWNGLDVSGSGDVAWRDGRLTLSAVDAVSPGGAIRGRFEMEGKPWTLSGRVTEGNPRLWSAFGLVGWPDGDLNGVFSYHTAANGDGDIDATLGTSSIAGWDADSAHVRIRTSRTHSDSFNVVMVRRGGFLTLDAEADSRGWAGEWTATGYPLSEWPDGRATGLAGLLETGRGTVRGVEGELHVTGTLDGRNVDWFGAKADRWHVAEISGRLLPTPDLTARPRLDDLEFLGVHFDSVDASVRLGDATLAFAELMAHAGDTLVTMTGDADWDDDGWSLRAERAAATSDQFSWTAEPPLELSGDAQGVEFERLVAVDGDARLDIDGRWASPEGRYGWKLEGARLDISRLGLPLEWGLTGRADATLTVAGAGTSPEWRFDGRFVDPGAKGDEVDSLHLALFGREHEMRLEDLTLVADGGRVTGRLVVDRAPRAWPDTLTPDGIVRWVGAAGRWSGRIEARGFPLSAFADAVPATADFSGRVDGTLEVEGRPAAPRFGLAATTRDFAWRTYAVDEGRVRASYAGAVLSVDEFELTREGVVSSASGTLPLRLAVGRPVETPGSAMHFRMDVPDGDLAIVPLFVPQIGAAAGSFRMVATLEGTPERPDLQGSMTVRDGRLRLTGREEQFYDVRADISFDESRINLDTLTARQGREGVLRAGGTVNLSGLGIEGYRFDAALRDFTALESGLYSATFDGRFAITDGEKLHGETLPHVVGDIELLQARILLDFANQAEMAQFTSNTQPLFWTYRVNLRATNKLKWEPPNANVEFSADLTLEQTVDSLAVFGEINSLRGQYWFLSNRFDVLKANLLFDNVGGIDPQLDIEAETRLRPSSRPRVEVASQEDDRSPETITVRITGRSRKPELVFSSSPRDWDQPRVLEELTVGRLTDSSGEITGQSLGDPLDDYVTRAINRQLSQEMSKVFQGYVNEWAFRRESGGLFTGEGDLYAEVGIPLSTQWQIRYSQRVPGLGRPSYSTTTQPLERDLEVEYRLSRFFYVTSEVLQRRTTTASTATSSGAEFNVNLKARWEY